MKTWSAGERILANDLNDNFNYALSVQNYTAGENLSVNDAVYLKASDGKVWKCDADLIATLNFIGFAKDAVSANATVTVQTVGKVTGFSSLTIGAVYYLSGTAGAITTTPPTNIFHVGRAVSATEILIYTDGNVIKRYYTSSSTWTKPAGLKYLIVKLVGGGGGSYGSPTAGSANQGGTSSFGSHLQATGGYGDAGSAGFGSGGDFNVAGGCGTVGLPSGGIGGTGGGSLLGGGGKHDASGVGYGAGAGGKQGSDSGRSGTNGGSGGGYSEKKIPATSLGASETVTVGGGGAGSGYSGYDGIVIVEEYY